MAKDTEDGEGSPSNGGQPNSDVDLAEVDGLISGLERLRSAIEIWTIPSGQGQQPGRRVHQAGGPAALTAQARVLGERLWNTRERLIQKHQRRLDGGPENSSNKIFTFGVGWGQIDHSLWHAIEEARDILFVSSVRADKERKEHRSGVPRNTGFEQDDIITTETMDRLFAVAGLFRAVRDGSASAPSDPFAVLFPGSTGPRVEAAQTAWGPPPEMIPSESQVQLAPLVDSKAATLPPFETDQQPPSVDETRLGTERNPNSIICRGNLWDITFGGITESCKGFIGMHYVRALLMHPGDLIGCATLVDTKPGSTRSVGPSMDEMQEAGLSFGGAEPDTVIDAEARALCLQARDLLKEQIEEAESTGDQIKVKAKKEELAQVESYLGSATRRGELRWLDVQDELARKKVTAAIQRAFEAVEGRHPSAGAHFRAYVRLGARCSYKPPEGTIHWQ